MIQMIATRETVLLINRSSLVAKSSVSGNMLLLTAPTMSNTTTNAARQLLRDGIINGVKRGARMWLLSVEEAEKIRKLPSEVGRPRKFKK